MGFFKSLVSELRGRRAPCPGCGVRLDSPICGSCGLVLSLAEFVRLSRRYRPPLTKVVRYYYNARTPKGSHPVVAQPPLFPHDWSWTAVRPVRRSKNPRKSTKEHYPVFRRAFPAK